MGKFIEKFNNEQELENFLSVPNAELIDMMKRLDGDIMILGIAGKMGVTMGKLAVNAIREANVDKKVYGVARFSDAEARKKLEDAGIQTIVCDLLDREAVAKLPKIKNIIFMAGRKFGTDGSEDLTWMMNTVVPSNVIENFKDSRITAFSTGCVYPLVNLKDGGCTEKDRPGPIGEYSQSCLGRERVFEYGAKAYGIKTLLYRLNYAIDLRYGVLHDIAQAVWKGEEVNNTVGYFNVIWQGDANHIALRSLELADSPAAILNVTGPEILSVETVAKEFGRLFGKEVRFKCPETTTDCFLSDASVMTDIFGNPSIPVARMIKWQAAWIADGGKTLNKPTHYEVNTGKF